MPVIGFLGTLAAHPTLKHAFQVGLGTGGFTAKKWGMKPPANLKPNEVYICEQWADGDYASLDKKAKALYAVPDLKLIATTGGEVSRNAAMKAANGAKSTIPILYVSGRAPHPIQANVKGVNLGTSPLSLNDHRPHKLLKELLGGNPKIFHLVNPNSGTSDDEKKWGNRIEAATVKDLKAKFDEAIKNGADAITVSADPYFNTHRAQIIKQANRVKKPVCYHFVEYVRDGGLVSAGPNLAPAYCQLGAWAAELLKKPGLKADSLENYTAKQEIGINLAAASTLNLPPANLAEILAKADVIV